MANKTLDVIVIGGGPQRPRRRRLPREGGQRVVVLERAERVGGILRRDRARAGLHARPGSSTRSGRLRASRREGPEARPVRLSHRRRRRCGCTRRCPTARRSRSGPTPTRTAEELRDRSPTTPTAFVAFDKKVRAIASFLAYVSVATPPDPKSPSLADAIMGLKLGKAFRDLGAQDRPRGDPRAARWRWPTSCRRCSTRRRSAGRSRRAASCTRRWAPGRPAPRRCSCTTRPAPTAARPARPCSPVGGTGALADALERGRDALGVQIRTGAEVVAIRNRGTRAIGVTLADGTELDAPLIVSAADPKRTAGLCDPVTLGPTMVWRDGQHPPAGRDGARQPRAVGAAGVPRRRRRAARAAGS